MPVVMTLTLILKNLPKQIDQGLITPDSVGKQLGSLILSFLLYNKRNLFENTEPNRLIFSLSVEPTLISHYAAIEPKRKIICLVWAMTHEPVM